MERESLLTRLEGSELAQVWCVRDYLQLIFEGIPEQWSWQCYTWPTVERARRTLGYGDPGYRDALSSLIGSTVFRGQESPAFGLSVALEAGTIALNPSGDEILGHEIAMLHVHGEPGEWMVWRPGEDTFSHLP